MLQSEIYKSMEEVVMSYELLIVDDEYQSRNTLCTCFPWESVGFHVVGQTYNGLEALKFLEMTKVHVILCDIKMPVMSGIDLAKKLAIRPEAPVIIFLSGYRDFEYAQNALKYGVRYYIVKPARYEELYELLDEDLFVQKICSYVKENYRTASLTEAASILYMNASYVSQLFKQKTGQNFSEYLLEIRMKKAVMLLADPHIKIYNISNQVGYTNAKNFTRSFRNFYGKTPKEYRENLRLGGQEGEAYVSDT